MVHVVTYLRHSPVQLKGQPAKTEQRDGWNVVLQYANEGKGPSLIDLSHRIKWDVQNENLSRMKPAGVNIPETPGRCIIHNGLLVSRMNHTQAAVWHLWGEKSTIPGEPAYTDVTEAFALLAFSGKWKDLLSIMEKVTALDFASPEMKPPFLIQGPVVRVPCQIVVLGEKDNYCGVLIACSRGYGQSMADELLDAGSQEGLYPAGEAAFCNWVKGLSG